MTTMVNSLTHFPELLSYFFSTSTEMNERAALENFAIHSRSGMITTSEVLDYEARPNYELVIVARDRGIEPKESFQTVIIDVVNVDDKPPLIPSEHISLVVVENTEINTMVGQVRVNGDKNNEGSPSLQISYHLYGGNVFGAFALNRTSGVISTIRNIDFEEASFHNLSIQAVDNSSSLPRSTNISVTINVSCLPCYTCYFLKLPCLICHLGLQTDGVCV